MKKEEINELNDEEIENVEEDIIEEIEDIEEVIEDIRNDIEILHKHDRYIFLILIGMFAVLLILGITIVTNLPAVQTEPAGTGQKAPTNQNAQQSPEDLSEGQAAGVSGTPSSVVNGQLVVGAQPYDNFKNIVDTVLSTTV